MSYWLPPPAEPQLHSSAPTHSLWRPANPAALDPSRSSSGRWGRGFLADLHHLCFLTSDIEWRSLLSEVHNSVARSFRCIIWPACVCETSVWSWISPQSCEGRSGRVSSILCCTALTWWRADTWTSCCSVPSTLYRRYIFRCRTRNVFYADYGCNYLIKNTV